LSHERTLDVFQELVDHPLVQLVSVMDHSPGQRQFVKLAKYREYYQGKYQLNDTEMAQFIERQVANSRKYSHAYRQAIVRECHRRGLSVASHDDATHDHVEESALYGMSIAEFPTTPQAACLSHEKGLKVLMGAPNVVRGGSHSGNVAAADLATQGVLDILSSDYYPASLLQAVQILSQGPFNCDLPTAVSMVSLAPAQAAGLHDRGQIHAGLRADMVRVRPHAGRFVVNQVWRTGQRVF
jgi:alpha-D-ribose 1-methylphosphonate 5-triphosphate diphosphatase